MMAAGGGRSRLFTPGSLFFRNLSLGGARVGKEKFGSCDDVVARCFAQIILVAVFREWET